MLESVALYRGRSKEDGEWELGFYVRLYDHKNHESHRIYPGYAETCCGDYYPDWFEVESETVGQFTGLTDKNDVRIFVGDIIRSDNGKQSAVSVVKCGLYCPTMFYKMLDLLSPKSQHLPAGGFFAKSVDCGEEIILLQSPCVEVIGNIHDNPELLEVIDNA